MVKRCAAFATLTALVLTSAAYANTERYLGGFECTDDCSGHRAGYLWAERNDITDEVNCPDGNSNSFYEGCVAYTEDPSRGADKDDDGEEIED
jgi:hypothetical protein